MKNKIIKTLIVLFSTVGIFSLILFLPSVQNFIINFFDKQNVATDWQREIIHREILFIIFDIFLCLALILFNKTDFSNKEISIFQPIKFNDFPKQRFYILLSIIFIFISFLRFYWCNHKTDFFIDEYFEISISNRNENGFGMWRKSRIGELELNRAYSGNEIIENRFFNDNTFNDLASDIAHLWVNTHDYSHTALHYMLTRLIFAGKSANNISEIILRNNIFNFLLFCISFFVMLKLLIILYRKKLSILILLTISFANPASIFLNTYMRSYALQETAILFFTYLFVKYFLLYKNNENKFSLKFYIKTILIVTFTISTDYFPLFYVIFFYLYAVIIFYKKKDFNSIFYFSSIIMFSYVAANLLYSGYGMLLFGGHATKQAGTLSNPIEFIKNVALGLIGVYVIFQKYFVPVLFLAIPIVINFYMFCINNMEKIKEKKFRFIFSNIFVVLTILVFIWILFIQITAPYKDLRYIAPAFCLLPICLIPVFDYEKKYFFLILIVQTIFCGQIILNSLPFERNYRIPWLNGENCREMVDFYNNPQIPVVIEKNAQLAAWLPYVNQNQTYYIVENEEDARNLNLGKYYFLTSSNLSSHYVNQELKE